MHQNATPLRKSAPWPHAKCIFADPLQMSQACKRYRNCYKITPILLTFEKVQDPLCLPIARRNDIWTSKSAPNPSVFNTFDFETCFAPQRRALVHHLNFPNWSKHVVFAHFDFEMCFAPQWHALFRHLNFQKCSDVEVFCTCWLRNVLRATTACNFSSLVSPDGSAPAALTSLLFDPPEPPIIGKTQCFATFLPFCAPACSFFWLFLFSDLLSPSLFFSDSSHLCFSSLHIVARCRKLDF